MGGTGWVIECGMGGKGWCLLGYLGGYGFVEMRTLRDDVSVLLGRFLLWVSCVFVSCFALRAHIDLAVGFIWVCDLYCCVSSF